MTHLVAAGPTSRSVALLIRRYREGFSGVPPWAFDLAPTIPFVGKAYARSAVRMAVYASAENLSHYVRRPELRPAFLQDDRVWNRHRAAFQTRQNGFFRRVHIAPVSNGCLLCAALFVRRRLRIPSPRTLSGLLEELVAGNVGKFAVDGATNTDYAGTPRRLRASLSFLRMDLDVLKPKVLLLPRTMFRHPRLQAVVRDVVPGCLVLPVPQFNARVVNTHLRRHERRAKELASELAGTQIARWTSQLQPRDAGNPYRYYAEIEEVLRGVQEPHRNRRRALALPGEVDDGGGVDRGRGHPERAARRPGLGAGG